MNKTFRVVWNDSKGCWVAASEIARGGVPGNLSVRSALFAALLAASPWGQAQQQPSAIPSDGNTRSYVAPNGTTVVDIARPNGAGVSNNVYSTFNVNPQGLVLNNGNLSQLSRNSQLAGAVSANTNLDREASLILNQVNSANRSLLNGFTEVLGSRADVVVANPNGISCAGCGFINTDRVTLTTGLPVFGADGSLTGFNVTRGDVDISGNGLNASAQQILDLVTRSVSLSGQINVPDLGIFLGPNAWTYGNRQVTGLLAGEGGSPAFALDSAALGGMYANRIFLVATEAGVGVRMNGEVSAGNGDFTLDAAGNVRLAGRVSATGDLNLSTRGASAGLVLADASLRSGGAMGLDVGGQLQLAGGALVAGTDLDVRAAGLQDSASSAGVTDNNTRFAQGAVSVQVAGGAALDGTRWGAGQTMTVEGGSLAVGAAGAHLYSSGPLQIGARTGDLALGSALVQSTQDLVLNAAGAVSSSAGAQQGLQSATGDIRISAQGAARLGGNATADQGNLTVQTGGNLDTGGSLYARQNMVLGAAARTGALQNTGTLQADGQMDLLVATVGNSGQIQAARSTDAQLGSLNNSGTWLLSTADAGGTDRVTVSGQLTNTGTLQSAQDLSLSVASLDNSGRVLGAQDLSLTATLDVTGRSGSVLQAGDAFSASARNLNNAGTVKADTADLRAQQSLGNTGTVQADTGAVVLRAGTAVDNSGTVRAATTLSIGDLAGGGSQSLRNSGQLQSDGSLDLRASTATNTAAGRVQAATGSTVTAGSLTNQGSWLLSTQAGAGSDTVSVSGAVQNTGTLQSARDLSLAAASLNNGGSLLAAGDLAVTTTGTATNTAGAFLQAGDALSLSAQSVRNDGTVKADAVAVTARNGLDNRGLVQADLNGLTLRAGGTLANSGTLYGRTAVDLADAQGGASENLSNSGQIESDGTLNLRATQVGNAAAGRIQAASSTTVAAASLNNQGTWIGSTAAAGGPDQWTVSGGAVNSGTLQSAHSATLSATTLDNSGRLLAATDLDLRTTSDLRNLAGGTLQAGGTLGATTNQLLTNGVGALINGNRLALTANGLDNSGTIQGGASTTSSIDVSDRFTNRSGAVLNMASQAGGNGQLSVWSLDNLGTLQSIGGLRLRIRNGLLDTNRSIVAGGTLDIASGSQGNALQVRVSGGATLQGGTLGLTASDVTLAGGGSLQSVGDLNLTTGFLRFDDSASFVMAARGGTGAGNITTSALAVGGGIYSNNHLSISANGLTVTNTGGIAALGDLSLNSSGSITNSGSLYAGRDLSASAPDGAIANAGDARQATLGTVYAGRDISLSTARLVNQSSIQAGRNLSVSAFDIQNVTPGGDTRVWGGQENLQQTVTEVVAQGYNCTNGCVDQSQWTSYLQTWSTSQRYANGQTTIVARPQLIAGNVLGLTDFQTASNLAGVISGRTVNITGRGGASFVNDDLALQRRDYRRTWRDYILYVAAGPVTYVDEDFYEDTGGVLVNTATVYSPGAGIYANTLNAGGFSLTNRGSPFSASGNAPTGGGSAGSLQGAAGGANGANPTDASLNPGTTGLTAGNTPGAAGTPLLNGISFGGITIVLPSNPNGLFVLARDPAAQYLVVSNPRLGSLYPGFSGSSYLLAQLGLNPETVQKRLGDAGYEAYLIQQQLIAQAGSNLLKGYTDQQSLLQSLMSNGVAQANAMGLTVGTALTAQQQSQLQQDVVWLVSMKVQGQDVLVPQVYLSPATVAGIGQGVIIAANSANLALESLDNTGGTIRTTGALNISTTGDLVNRSGSIQGGDVNLSAGGSIRNETVTRVDDGGLLAGTSVGKTGAITATGALDLSAKQDITVSGAQLGSGGDTRLDAGGSVTLGTVQTTTANRSVSNDGKNRTVSDTREERQIGSEVNTGGNLSIRSGQDITVAGSTVNSTGNATLDAGGQLNITAVGERSTTSTDSVGRDGLAWATENTRVDQTTGKAAALNTGGNLTLSSGKDTEIKGSDVTVGGNLDVAKVGGDLRVTTFEEKSQVTSTTESYSVFGTEAKADAGKNIAASKAEASVNLFEKKKETLEIESTTNKASTLLVGGNLNAGAGAVAGDVVIKGSDVAVGGNLNLQAGRDIRIEAAQDTTSVKQSSQSEKLSLGAEATLEGPGAKVGYDRQESSGTASQSTARVSTLQAGQDINLNAGRNLSEQGTQVQAGGNVAITADKVDSLAAQNSFTQTGDALSVSASLGVKVETGLSGVASSFVDDKNNARFDMAAASESLSALSTPNGGNVKLDLTVTTKRTVSSGSGNDATASSLTSGGNTSIRARTGDVTLQGTDVTAGGNIAVSADKGSVNVGTADSRQTSTSTTTDVEVSVGVYADGTVSGSGSGGRSTESSGSSAQKAASFKAGGDVALAAAKDVTLVGTAIDAKGTVDVTATDGKIDFKAARSTTEASADEVKANASFTANVAGREGSLGGGASTTNSSSSSSTGTAGSINAANINLRSKGDITLEGTRLDATDKLRVDTEGKLDYQALADTSTSRKTGARAQVDLEAGKTGGGVKVGAGTTDEFESTTTRTGGTLNAGSLEIRTGQGVRLEGTQVNVKNDATIDAGQGQLVIESAVSEHTKKVNNTDVSVSAKVEMKEGSGQAGFKIDGSYEDTQKVSNTNASLNIGGKADLKAAQGIDIKGKDVKDLSSVVTAQSVDTHNAEVRTEQRSDVDRSSQSDVFISVGGIAPERKARNQAAETFNKAATSETANTLRNQAVNATTTLSNAKASVQTQVANTMGDLRTAARNLGADATQKAANNEANATARQANNDQLVATVQGNRDAATEQKLQNNLQQAVRQEARETARVESRQTQADDRARVVMQKANQQATTERDQAVAAISPELKGAQREKKLQEINTRFESAKAANTRAFDDARTNNAAQALEEKTALIDQVGTRREEARQRAGDATQRHQDTATDARQQRIDERIGTPAPATPAADARLTPAERAQAQTGRAQAQTERAQVQAEGEQAKAATTARTEAARATEQAEAERARQDNAAQIQQLRDVRKFDREADEKIEQARQAQARADLQVRQDTGLGPVERAQKLAENAQTAKRAIEAAQADRDRQKTDAQQTYQQARDANAKQRDEKAQLAQQTQRTRVADAELAARRQVADARIAEAQANAQTAQQRIRDEATAQRKALEATRDAALAEAQKTYDKAIAEGKPEAQARTARESARTTAQTAYTTAEADSRRDEAAQLQAAQTAGDAAVDAARQARAGVDTADQQRRTALTDQAQADKALADLLDRQRGERRDAAAAERAAEQALQKADLSDEQRATRRQQLLEQQADARKDLDVAQLRDAAAEQARRDDKAKAAELAAVDPLLSPERQTAAREAITQRYQARADERAEQLRDGESQAAADADQRKAQARREGARALALAQADAAAEQTYRSGETAANDQLRKDLRALDARSDLAPAERATLKEQARMAAGRAHLQRVADRDTAQAQARFEQDRIALDQQRDDDVRQVDSARDKALAAQPAPDASKRRQIQRRHDRTVALADKKKPLRLNALEADLKTRLANIDLQRQDAEIELGSTVGASLRAPGREAGAGPLREAFQEAAQTRREKAADLLATEGLADADAGTRQRKDQADERAMTAWQAADERATADHARAVDRVARIKDPAARSAELTRVQDDLVRRLDQNEQKARDALVANRNQALQAVADAALKSARQTEGADQSRRLADAGLLQARTQALVERSNADRTAERDASAETRRLEADLASQLRALDADTTLSDDVRALQRTQKQREAQTAIAQLLDARDLKLAENARTQAQAEAGARRQQAADALAADDRQRRDAAAATLAERKQAKPDDVARLDTAHTQQLQSLDARRDAEQAYAQLVQRQADERQQADEDARNAAQTIRQDDQLKPGQRAQALHQRALDDVAAARQRDLDHAQALADQQALVLRAAQAADLAGLDPTLGASAKAQATRDIETRYQQLDTQRQAALTQRQADIRLQAGLETKQVERARDRDQALAKVESAARKTFTDAQRAARQKLDADLKQLEAVKGLSAADRDRARADLQQAAEKAARERLAQREKTVSDERLGQDLLDHAQQRDAERTLAQARRDEALAQLGGNATAAQRQAIEQRFTGEREALDRRFEARGAEARARDKERQAAIAHQQAQALADLGLNATRADRDTAKAANAAGQQRLLDEAQALREKASDLMDPLLTSAERRARNREAAIRAGTLLSPDDIRVRARQAGLKVARWGHLLGVGGVHWRSKPLPTEELENTLITADLLLLARQFDAGDQGLALRVLRDPAAQQGARLVAAVDALRETAREDLLTEITASYNGGNGLAVLGVADQRRYLEQLGEVSADEALTPAQVVERFNAHLDAAAAAVQPSSSDQLAILTELGYTVDDPSTIGAQFDAVVQAGRDAIGAAVSQLGLPAQRAEALAAALKP